MKRVVAFALVLAMLGWAAPARAVIGTIDHVPAATLLLPYFEVDLNNPNGLTTLVSINNASATAVLAHVVIWSDLSVHMLDFNVYLTGYDVQTINIRDIITSPGVLPRTASAGQDPAGAALGVGISPRGPFSQDINFASCAGFLPLPNLDDISPLYIPHLQQGLTGNASPIFGGLCAGQKLGDNVARGYITVDTVNACSTLFPGNPGYFGPVGVVTNQNVLWGDFFIVNAALNYAQGGPLVHIEASPGVGGEGTGTYPLPGDPRTTTPGLYTFYGRYVAWTAVDNREALATTFAARYLNGGIFSGGTDLLVWRDAKVDQQPFSCASKPSWYPLGQEQIVVFDEREQADLPPGCPVSPCVPDVLTPFPAETQRTHVGGPSFPVPFDFGWVFLNLNTFVSPAGNNPPIDPAEAQAWVIATHSSAGRFAVGVEAIQLDTATSLFANPHLTIP
jgi:hypothetical protein